jgi:hypothetical protein
VVACDVACRETKKPHLQVLLAIADKPAGAPKSKRVKTG